MAARQETRHKEGDERASIEVQKVLAVGASLLLAGLTITCSLSLNNLMNAGFNYYFPEPKAEDLKRRFMYRAAFFLFVLILVAVVAVFISSNKRVKQSLIDMDDFALGN